MQSDPGLALGVLAALRSVEGHPLLDRLIRGRLWIMLVTFALIGIVTLQLGLLKLNAGIGRTLEQTASLQRQNAALSIENSELAAGDLVETSAVRLGMELVPIGALRFLRPHPRADALRAAAALSAPVHTASPSEPTSVSAASASTAAATVPSAEQSTGSSPAAEPRSEEATPAPISESGVGEVSSGASPQTPSVSAPPATQQSSVGSAGASPAGEASPAGGTQAAPTG